MTTPAPATPITGWRTIDFSPATGWLLVYLSNDAPGGYFTVPMVGWLIQEECDLDPVTDAPILRKVARTRVVAGVAFDGVVEEADAAENFWQALPISAPAPTAEAARQESAERRRRLGPDRTGRTS
ncbi:hypothetical protein GCM10022252_76090 [Streptosporangium oxazolinicum]|uniref:Uncharacterized protein n=1 Tax=Streptosporangium oxazolinicum TaxID=909287 RepID=A0ABP8BL29_9ACTN